MAVRLRLMRMGKKKQPTYRIVAADAHLPELADRNPEFRERWDRYTVTQPREQLQIPFRDPDHGDVTVDQVVLMFDDPSQRLLLFMRSSDADAEFTR